MDDLISRQAAIDALDVLCQEHSYKIPGKGETYSQYNEAWQDALDRAEGAIFNLPPAEPKRGKWIKKHRHYGGFRSYTGFDAMGEQHTITVDERTEYDDLYCSECGARSADNFLNFCPKCGSYNGGENDT